VCDCAPFLRRSDVHDFRYGAKIGAIPDLEASSVSEQEEASDQIVIKVSVLCRMVSELTGT
jgi:hypothetical protein